MNFPRTPTQSWLPRLALSTLILAAALAASSSAKAAEPPPGTTIDRGNVDQYVDMLGASIKWVVDRGAHIKVVPYKKVAFPPRFAEATEK